MLGIEEIKRILPHRYPFLFVDRILEVEKEKRIVGFKNITVNEPFFEGHFPGRPILPGVIIIEAMAQVGGILYILSKGLDNNSLIYFMGVDKFKFRRQIVPGDQVRFELEVLHRHSRGWKMRGEGFVGDKLAASGELMAFVSESKVQPLSQKEKP